MPRAPAGRIAALPTAARNATNPDDYGSSEQAACEMSVAARRIRRRLEVARSCSRARRSIAADRVWRMFPRPTNQNLSADLRRDRGRRRIPDVAHHDRGAPRQAGRCRRLVLIRERDRGPEVLVGRRHSRVPFLPDIYVFPGGRVDDADSACQRFSRKSASRRRSQSEQAGSGGPARPLREPRSARLSRRPGSLVGSQAVPEEAASAPGLAGLRRPAAACPLSARWISSAGRSRRLIPSAATTRGSSWPMAPWPRASSAAAASFWISAGATLDELRDPRPGRRDAIRPARGAAPLAGRLQPGQRAEPACSATRARPPAAAPARATLVRAGGRVLISKS